MEIIFKKTAKKSNFAKCAEIFKTKEKATTFMVQESVKDYGEPIIVKDVTFDPIEGKIYLCYPFSVVVEEEINFSSLHELITKIRQTYESIYQNPIKYGIWGHILEELNLSSVTLYKDGSVEVHVES